MCHVAETRTLHVLVRHFHHQFRFQRLPGKILAAAPAALCPRHTASCFPVCRQMANPLLPWVIVQCVRAIWRQKVQQFLLFSAAKLAHTPTCCSMPALS